MVERGCSAVGVGRDLFGQRDQLGDDLGSGEVLVGVLVHQIFDALGDGRRASPARLGGGAPQEPDGALQATLAHAAKILGTYGIDVEVVGIPAA
jgi:hypothetical protein